MEKKEELNEAHEFYKEALELLNKGGFPFLIGGGFAMRQYTNIHRNTKDLDIFCKPGDYTHILKLFADAGYKIQLTDVRWLAKIFKDDYFIDIIFDTVNNICRVDDNWLNHAIDIEVYGIPVKCMAAEELFWCKIYVQNRERYDGADLNHLILKQGKTMDWKRIWLHLEQHWQLLLSVFINFQFVYPADRDIIPKDIFFEMMERVKEQYELPTSIERVCRGPIIDQTQYQVDIKEWDYKVVTIKTV